MKVAFILTVMRFVRRPNNGGDWNSFPQISNPANAHVSWTLFWCFVENDRLPYQKILPLPFLISLRNNTSQSNALPCVSIYWWVKKKRGEKGRLVLNVWRLWMIKFHVWCFCISFDLLEYVEEIEWMSLKLSISFGNNSL